MALFFAILFFTILPIVMSVAVCASPNKSVLPLALPAVAFVIAIFVVGPYVIINHRLTDKANPSDTTSISNLYSHLISEDYPESEEIREYRNKLEIESRAEIEKKKAEIKAEFQAKQQKELDELRSDLAKKKDEIASKADAELHKELKDFKNEIEKKKESLKLKIMSEWTRDFDEFKAQRTAAPYSVLM